MRAIAPAEIFEGERVNLRLVTLADCTDEYVAWLADPEVARYLETRHRPQPKEAIESFVRGMIASADSYLFAIVDRASNRHVGNIKIGPIQPVHRFADVSYFIGVSDVWGRGLASDAIRVASRIAFDRLDLHRVQAGFYDGHIASQRALEKAGFTYEARMRKQLRLGDEWVDHVWYARLRDDT
jgi:RimJ/RimL family protein N-acetyltransferase